MEEQQETSVDVVEAKQNLKAQLAKQRTENKIQDAVRQKMREKISRKEQNKEVDQVKELQQAKVEAQLEALDAANLSQVMFDIANNTSALETDLEIPLMELLEGPPLALFEDPFDTSFDAMMRREIAIRRRRRKAKERRKKLKAKAKRKKEMKKRGIKEQTRNKMPLSQKRRLKRKYGMSFDSSEPKKRKGRKRFLLKK